ncbi:MAG: acyl carrier protein [Mycobacterium sp.]|uniref:acyl carrier protein n=1 Tax=Mycobacterium sp. TaxID=1785 RepID=UPI003F981D55
MTTSSQELAIHAIVTLKIIDLVKAEAKQANITADSNLADVGLDSLRFMSVVFKIEADYDIELQEEDADDLRTVGDLANLVIARIAEQS